MTSITIILFYLAFSRHFRLSSTQNTKVFFDNAQLLRSKTANTTGVKEDSSRQMDNQNLVNDSSEAFSLDPIQSLSNHADSTLLSRKSACNSTAAQMGEDPSEAQGILENPQSLPSIHTEDKTQAVPTQVTKINLAELERQQEMLWTDPAKATRQRQEQSRKIREGAVDLGVDVALPIFRYVGQSLDGMTPMERFVDGKDKS
ncbi:hypothetical protein V8E51_018116 [Hyaloscypha variabilis]